MLISLESMDDAAYAAWREASVRNYANEKVRAGSWRAEDALERAERDFATLLTEGRSTPGHQICTIADEAGTRVGSTWFVPEDRPFGRVIYIYDIEIDPAHRRQGHAMATLEAIERYARDHDCMGVQLHVFGGNHGARQLYQRAGFEETDVLMLKRVAR